jgi:hypothetical protein
MTDLIALKDHVRRLSSAERQTLTITAEELAAGYASLRANAPTRPQPYLSASRAGVPPIDPTERRTEERLAMALFNRGQIGISGGGELTMLDYQMPLKAARSDRGIGKVDIVGLCEDGVLAVIELKVAGSREDRRIALLEGLIYAAVIEANLSNIAREARVRLGRAVKAIPPRIFIVAPPEYWADPRSYPKVGEMATLIAQTSELVKTRVELLSLNVTGQVSLGLDGSKPTMVDAVMLEPVR